MTRIPPDPNGYSVTRSSGTIHTRYAAHAGAADRTRTAEGVTTMLDGREFEVCTVCYPAPRSEPELQSEPDDESDT